MNWTYVSFIGYLCIFILGVFGLGVWRVKRRKERVPVEFKLLRGPGESLRRRMAKFDEDSFSKIIGWALLPLVTALAATGIWFYIHKPTSWTELFICLGVTVLTFGATLTISIQCSLIYLMRYRSDRLGYLGERFVGEKLATLERKGFFVFHDVPAEAGNRKFNLDHVVVGPTGLWLIETKTRRKGRARPGFKDSAVDFDGTRLIWPWGEDRNGLDQAEAEARWLSEWIDKLTGFGVVAKPILTLPGWWVNERKLSTVRVLNPINIPSAIIGRGQRVLNDEQIDIIMRQLDERCRDVED